MHPEIHALLVILRLISDFGSMDMTLQSFFSSLLVMADHKAHRLGLRFSIGRGFRNYLVLKANNIND